MRQHLGKNVAHVVEARRGQGCHFHCHLALSVILHCYCPFLCHISLSFFWLREAALPFDPWARPLFCLCSCRCCCFCLCFAARFASIWNSFGCTCASLKCFASSNLGLGSARAQAQVGRLLRVHIVRICAIVCAQLPKIVASALIALVCVCARVCARVCVVLSSGLGISAVQKTLHFGIDFAYT